MTKSVQGWKRSEDGGYHSHHLLVTYYSRAVPEYFIRRNPYGEGWVLLSFDTRLGTYTKINALKPFRTLADIKKYVDVDVQEFERGYK